MGLMTSKELVVEITKRQAEYKKFLRKMIRATDARYRKTEKESLARANRPVRHPKGQTFQANDREFLWNDAVWCGDITLAAWDEFVGGITELTTSDCEHSQELLNDIWNAVWAELKKELDLPEVPEG